jgi:hypothetical protein
MMEANTGNLNPLDLKKSVYCPGAKRLMALIKLMKLFVLRSESDPLGNPHANTSATEKMNEINPKYENTPAIKIQDSYIRCN